MSDAYFVIALSRQHPDHHESSPMYWCGYQSVGKTHSWLRGKHGFDQAVRFVRRTDALQAGVSGPNLPHAVPANQPERWPDRGVQVLRIEKSDQLELPVDTQPPSV